MSIPTPQTMRERFTEQFIATFSDDESTFFERVMAFLESEVLEAERRWYGKYMMLDYLPLKTKL